MSRPAQMSSTALVPTIAVVAPAATAKSHLTKMEFIEAIDELPTEDTIMRDDDTIMSDDVDQKKRAAEADSGTKRYKLLSSLQLASRKIAVAVQTNVEGWKSNSAAIDIGMHKPEQKLYDYHDL